MSRKASSLIPSCSLALGLALAPATALAQAPAPMGAEAPPPDAKALVAAPKGAKDAPAIAPPKPDETNANLAAGGLITTGNSKTVALTLNGQLDLRRGDNGFLFGALGNYGESSIKGAESRATAQNLQGKLRYDRYFLDSLSGFLILTGRHDKFQGLDFRFNLDPGVKYIPYKDDAQALWVELGTTSKSTPALRTGGSQRTPTGRRSPARPCSTRPARTTLRAATSGTGAPSTRRSPSRPASSSCSRS
ncbi:MAG: DUF481 domain-containing protein [Myxococcales bacterium]|jgi:hypothetical protein|nr:DUF481 domain-containing protein [Myxococcales bacterium]